MRDTPRGIVEELRAAAREDAADLGVDVADHVNWQAADYIEHLTAGLQQVADGAADPGAVARLALDGDRWVRGGN